MTARNISALLLIFLLIAFLLPCGYAGAQQEKPAEPSIPTYTISEAMEKGKIAVEAKGVRLSEVSVTIKKTTGEKFKVLIPVGTYFVAKGNYQSRVSRDKVIADLTGNKEVTVSVRAYCANAFKKIPESDDKFDIALSPEAEDLRKLMEVIAKKNPGEILTQGAVWIVTDDISRDDLDSRDRTPRSIFGFFGEPVASDENVIKAMALVEEAGIDLKKKKIYKERISAIRGLSSEDKTIQNLSLRFLNAEGKDRMEVLIEVLKDEDSDVRRSAVYAIGKLKDPTVGELLIEALKDKESKVRQSAARALGEIKVPRAVEPLIAALQDKDCDVRVEATEGLAKIKDPRAVEPLIKALKDENWNVRWSAAKALEKINPKWRETEEAKKWVPVFISDLKNEKPDIRARAAEALGELKDPRAVKPLIEALKDKNQVVKYRASNALEKINPKWRETEEIKQEISVFTSRPEK